MGIFVLCKFFNLISIQMANFVPRLAKFTIGLGLLGTGICASIFNVDAGYRAVIFDRIAGVKHIVKREGTHFRIPILQFPIMFDVRTRPRLIPNQKTGTKDLQTVVISLRILSRPLVEKLPQIYQQLGLDYDERVLPSIANEILKSVVAQYNADQLLTMREKVSATIKEQLIERAADFHIILDDVAITQLSYSREFAKAVEQKQVQQQLAERSKFIVMKTEQEREAAIIRAAGESEAAKLISKSVEISGPGLIEIRRIEAAREIAETLCNGQNVTYLPSNGNILYTLPTH